MIVSSRFVLSFALVVMLALQQGNAQETEVVASSVPSPGTVTLSVAQEVGAAIDRGLDWLVANQADSGAWSNDKFPALTALASQALLDSKDPDHQLAARRGLSFIEGCVQPDGGIYVDVPGRKGGGLANYNTAISMMALNAAGDPIFDKIILDARAFIAGAQHFGDDVYKGGFGYDASTKRAYTDLLNTYYATRAMHETQGVEDRRPASEKRVDIDWKETAAFVDRLQNKAAAGPDDAGGFVYNPADPKAGTVTNATGEVIFRSYGSITYAGLLALIYADVDRADPRVQSALDWAAKHWSLEENPGMGKQGLFFFYNVLTRALDAAGRDVVPVDENTYLNWREEVAKKVVGLQKIDPKTGKGYWLNDQGRFWESDPILATAYSLLALQKL